MENLDINSKKKDFYWNLTLLIAWSAFSIFNIRQHAFWMDEVINLVLGINADGIYGIHGNGHPAVWFVLLRFLYFIFHKVWILPLASFIVAFFAVYLFLFKSPFNRTFKLIFLCTNMCMFEYVVVARNYGISMLFMFIISILYSNDKLKYKFTGPMLFLLCNTNIPAALISCSFVSGNLLNSIKRNGFYINKDMKFGIKLFMYNLVGIVVCLFTVLPTFDTAAYLSTETQRSAISKNVGKTLLVSKAFNALTYGPYMGLIPDRGTKIDEISIAYELKRLSGPKDLYVDYPECLQDYYAKKTMGPCGLTQKHKNIRKFLKYQKAVLTVFSTIVIILSLFSLYGNFTLFVSAAFSLAVLDVFFTFGYWGLYRHQALWLAFMVSLLWISMNENQDSSFNEKQKKLRLYGYRSLLILLAMQIFPGVINIFNIYSGHQNSNSKSLASVINKDPELKNAAIISTNDLSLPALHYYMDNPTFYVTQRRFSLIFPFSVNAINFNSLDDILDDAEKISYCNNVNTIILVSTNIGRIDDDKIKKPTIFKYEYMDFYVTPKQLSRLYSETTKIASFKEAVLEDGYSVYKLKRSDIHKTYACPVEYKINRDYFKLNR
ncbi:hypothetical protein ACU81Q_04960 [Komagataeibacter melomenusus]